MAEKEGKAKQHQKNNKWRRVERWRNILGGIRIQGANRDEDLYYLLSKAMTRIELLHHNDVLKEQQICELLTKSNSNDVQKQIRLERENALLKTENGPREQKILRLQAQINTLKMELRKKEKEIENLKKWMEI